MIGITVSVNYDDLLNIVIPQNYKYFEKWYIITDVNDKNTIDVIRKYNLDNIHILYYNFHEGGKKFNKGGAIRYCQKEIISALNYNGPVILLDSDIYLPDNLTKIIENLKIEDDTLYGTNSRSDYFSYDHFIKNIVDYHYPASKEFHGYFQLYKYDKTKLYNESYNCSSCDLNFIDFFKKKVILTDLNVCHLGRTYINWDSRTNKNDFKI
jgi:hypothetical protein